MNRRSFLGLLPLAPIVGPALAKEAATGIADAVSLKRISGLVESECISGIGRSMLPMKPDIATLALEIDSASVDRAVATLRQAASCAAIGERGPEAYVVLPKDRDIPITIEDVLRRKSEAEAEQQRSPTGTPTAAECIPDDIWPI